MSKLGLFVEGGEQVNKTELCESMKKMMDDIDYLIKNISSSPVIGIPGRLICSSKGKRCQFYNHLEDGKIEYLGDSKKDLIKSLARKQHLKKMLETAKRERKQIEKCLKVLQSGRLMSDIDEVYPSLHPAVRDIEGPLKMTDDGYVTSWLSNNSILGSRKTLDGQHRTINGVPSIITNMSLL